MGVPFVVMECWGDERLYCTNIQYKRRIKQDGMSGKTGKTGASQAQNELGCFYCSAWSAAVS
jgi:hypothetical protein